MGKALVIVESPAKAKTINKYLGKDFVVKSSVGHIRDLPTSGSASPADPEERAAQAALTRKMAPDEKARYQARKKREQLIKRMGIDPENGWRARYEILPGKEKVVSELKRLAKDSDAIYLATDLDSMMVTRSILWMMGLWFRAVSCSNSRMRRPSLVRPITLNVRLLPTPGIFMIFRSVARKGNPCLSRMLLILDTIPSG